MKNIFIFLFFISLNLFAQVENPETFCEDSGLCSEKMIQMTEEFKKNKSIDFLSTELTGYSGECYHLSNSDDPEQKQHAAFVFEKRNQSYFADGEFAFFYEENPYLNLTTEEFRKKLLSSEDRFRPIEVQENQAVLGIDFDSADLKYWFRSSEDQKNLNLIGRIATSLSIKYLFCRLEKMK